MVDNGEGFEGCEKRLKIDFQPVSDLRYIPRCMLDDLLEIAKCSIISTGRSPNIDAYVLSESSLFIFAHTVIIKTCGTTCLLNCLYQLLKVAHSFGARPIFVQFSRSDFMFPQKQPFPHKIFSTEVDYLNQFFFGCGYVLGPADGPRWHVYTANVHVGIAIPTITLEILMWNLDENKMQKFYQHDDPEWTAKRVTSDSGIETIIPGSCIDEYLFDPCGYSCNGLLDLTYFTIHVTPEPKCSFVSFETNIYNEHYSELINKVVRIFQPQCWTISLMVQGRTHFLDARSLSDWHFQGFTNEGMTYHKFDGQDNLIFGRFKKDHIIKIQQTPGPKTYTQVIKAGQIFQLPFPLKFSQLNFTHFMKQILFDHYHPELQLHQKKLWDPNSYKSNDDSRNNFFTAHLAHSSRTGSIQFHDFRIIGPNCEVKFLLFGFSATSIKLLLQGSVSLTNSNNVEIIFSSFFVQNGLNSWLLVGFWRPHE